MSDRPVLSSRLVFGLCLIGLGVVWTLDQLGRIDASRVLVFWPIVPLVWGAMLVTGYGTRCRRTLGGIWLAVGLVAGLHKLRVWDFTLSDLFPLFLVFVGALLIARAWRGPRLARPGDGSPPPETRFAGPGASGSAWPTTDEPAARVNFFTLLSATRRRVTAQAFVGGEASAVLGGLTVDLRGAQLAQGRALLDVFAMWGGIEVLAPAGWRIVNRVTPLLGAVVDAMPDPAGSDAPTLEIRGLAVMGGVDVRSDDRVRLKIRRSISSRET